MIRSPRDADGFQCDLVDPGLDPLAYRYAVDHFGGEDRINHVLQTYQRSHTNDRQSWMSEPFWSNNNNREFAHESIAMEPSYLMALQSVRDEIMPTHTGERLVPLSFEAVETHPDLVEDRSPGCDLETKGFKSIRECLECIAERDRMLNEWEKIGRGKKRHLSDAALMGYDAPIVEVGDEEGEGDIDYTFVYPADVTVEEARFVIPFQEWLRTKSTSASVGYRHELSSGGMAYVNCMLERNRDCSFVCPVWKRFGDSVPGFVIVDAFRIIEQSFDFMQVKDSNGKYWPLMSKAEQRYRRRFSHLIDYFLYGAVRLPNGHRYRRQGHGTHSGSQFTPAIDTICSVIIMRYLCHETTARFPVAELHTGENSVLCVKDFVSMRSMAELAWNTLRMKLNVGRSYATRDPMRVSYLGYINNRGLPSKRADILIASFVYPLRTTQAKDPVERIANAVALMWSSFDAIASVKWLKMIRQMMKDGSLNDEQIPKFIRTHPSKFAFLSVIGIDLKTIFIPSLLDLNNGDGVKAMQPPTIPLHAYEKRDQDWDYGQLWKEALKAQQKEDCEDYEKVGKESMNTEQILGEDAPDMNKLMPEFDAEQEEDDVIVE